MTFDLKSFQKKLAQQKVYDTWQYVSSLQERLLYMDFSYELINSVYENRLQAIETKEQEKFKEVIANGKTSISEKDLQCSDINIAGLTVNDGIILRKTIIEFFHYARISVDILFQIINAALFGDKAYDITDNKLLNKVIAELKNVPDFTTLYQMLDDNKESEVFKYLQAFDNYTKHIKTILVVVENSIFFGDTNNFIIREFIFKNILYPEVSALDKIREINIYVKDIVEKVLVEVQKQLPNCLDNSQRIQEVSFKQLVKEDPESSVIEYISFFINVQNDISELPAEIKVLPLIIKPNDEIYRFDFRVDKIFIKKQGYEEDGIIGCAELKNGLNTNEFYRVFEVRPCTIDEYNAYIFSFAQKKHNIMINQYAMSGEIILCKD